MSADGDLGTLTGLRVVVCSILSGRKPFQLRESRLGDRTRGSGGERSLYELATALTVAGHDVELRGDIVERTLREITDAAGAAPKIDLPAREPEAGEIVIVSDGETDPETYGAIALSPAQGVVMLLGPPGQYGWNFVDRKDRGDLLTFPIDFVGRPEHFQAIRGLGFDLWSNSPGLAAASEAAGVPCTCLQTGNPVGFPDLVAKTHDVAFVGHNKWTPLARKVVEQLPDLTCLELGDQGHRTLAGVVGQARILIWPSRIEGDSRIQREARAMGTVPVALSTNRFAAGLDDDGGAVLVDSVDEMPDAICTLLADPEDLAARAERAVTTSRAWAAWEPYVERVDKALHALGAREPAADARAVIGRELAQTFREQRRRITELEHEVSAYANRRSVWLADELRDLFRWLRRR